MAKDEPVDHRLCQGMCHLSTKQNSDPQEKDPTLWNHNNPEHETLHPNCNGSDHGPTPSKWERCNTNHSGSWLFQGGNLHPLLNNHHWTGNCPTILLRNIYPWFGLPSRVISDRDPRFTSQFEKALTMKLGINCNISMAFHPQMDGLSERKNQWVEQYLWIFTSANPEDWTQWLALASAVHNNRRNTTTGLSPNRILLGYEPQLTPEISPPLNNDLAEEHIRKLMENRDQATRAINKAAKGNRTIPEQYHTGDQVWLEGKYLKFPHQATKLNLKHYGPFRVIKGISPVAYQLQLPPSWNIHPIFHASLLLPYHETPSHGPNISRPPPDLIDGEEEFEVEQIKAHQNFGRSKCLQYLIKWKGYPKSDNTWESTTDIHAPELVKQYHKHHPL